MKKRMNAKGKGRIGNEMYKVNTDGENEIENKGTEEEF